MLSRTWVKANSSSSPQVRRRSRWAWHLSGIAFRLAELLSMRVTATLPGPKKGQGIIENHVAMGSQMGIAYATAADTKEFL